MAISGGSERLAGPWGARRAVKSSGTTSSRPQSLGSSGTFQWPHLHLRLLTTLARKHFITMSFFFFIQLRFRRLSISYVVRFFFHLTFVCPYTCWSSTTNARAFRDALLTRAWIMDASRVPWDRGSEFRFEYEMSMTQRSLCLSHMRSWRDVLIAPGGAWWPTWVLHMSSF